MNALLKTLCAAAGVALAAQAMAQITFYENDGFRGRSFTSQAQVTDINRFGFNELASSAEVTKGWWEVCEDTNYSGRCVLLRPGKYPSLAVMNLNDRVSSARTVDPNTRVLDPRYTPMPMLTFDR